MKTRKSAMKRHAAQRHISLLDAAREAGLIESLAKRTAVEVARFMAMYDAMRLVGDERVEEAIGRVLHHTAYREWLAESQSEEDQQRVERHRELAAGGPDGCAGE